MKNTFLFDLDGTLLQTHMNDFVKTYLKSAMKYFSDLVPSEKFFEYMDKSTYVLMTNTDMSILNYDVFFNKFLSLSGADSKKCMERFDDFYDEVFDSLKPDYINVNQNLIMAVELLKEKGYKLIVASNPVFPLKAQLFRLKWAGFCEEDFEFITTIENMNICKPYTNFYQSILDKIGKCGDECYMIGNDVTDDMSAMKVGIEVILLDEYLTNNEKKEILCKTMNTIDFLKFVENLRSIN